jgi:hypothetical protein
MSLAAKTLMLALSALLLPSLAGAQEPSLAEVARQKSGKAASRVLSNEDLEAGRAPEAARPAGTDPAADKEQAEARITVPGLLQEASLKEARAILESLKRDEEVLLRRYAQIQEKLSRETDEHLRTLYSNSLARRDETLARKRGQIAEVEKAIRAGEKSRAPSPGSRHEKDTRVAQ